MFETLRLFMRRVQHILPLTLLAILAGACTLAAPITPTPVPTATIAFTPIPTVTLTPTPAVPVTPTVPPVATQAPTALASAGVAAASVPEALGRVGNQLYLWEAPNNLSAVLGTVTEDDVYELVGRTGDSAWAQVRLADEREGWFVAAALDEADLTALPVAARSVIEARVVLVPSDSPTRTFFTDAGEADELERLQPVRIDARTIDNAWLYVGAAGGKTGWMSAEDVDVSFDLTIVEVREFSEPTIYRGTVQTAAGGLRLRRMPNTESTILFNLQADADLEVQGRTQDSAWVLVKLPEGFIGWTSAAYIDYEEPLNAVPVITNPEPAPYVEPDIPDDAPNVSIVRAPSVNLAANSAPSAGGNIVSAAAPSVGAGNRSNVFTTVGDSITDTPYFLRQIVNGYNLRDYGYLLPTLQYYNVDVGDGNAFSRRAASTKAGWSTLSLFEPLGDGRCQPGEDALRCEYRLTRPAVALVMVGTNDAPGHSPQMYREQMQRILDISLDSGVVPILSTLPPRRGFDGRINEYNGVLRQLSVQYNVPLVDLHGALVKLPNQGLSADGVHLSLPPGGTVATMDFTSENLRYGTTMRNLTALQVLHDVRQQLGL